MGCSHYHAPASKHLEAITTQPEGDKKQQTQEDIESVWRQRGGYKSHHSFLSRRISGLTCLYDKEKHALGMQYLIAAKMPSVYFLCNPSLFFQVAQQNVSDTTKQLKRASSCL
jgi:hypothetical protein